MARESKGKAGGRTGSAAAPPCRGRKGERRKEGGKRGLTGGTHLSAPLWKRKEKGEKRWAGGESWAGPPGPKGSGAGFCFFFFSFSNFIFKSIFNSNSNQTFANFSQIFYRLFRDHTSNQKPCKPNDDAHTLVVSKFIILSLIFLELKLNSNLISLNP
jgi:hypothetical protein